MTVVTRVARVLKFRARHSLPEFNPPWCYEHEHDYRITVVAQGGTDTDRIDAAFRAMGLPDSNMNDFFCPSTVENVAEGILEYMSLTIPVVAVRVQEDDARWGTATITGSPRYRP